MSKVKFFRALSKGAAVVGAGAVTLAQQAHATVTGAAPAGAADAIAQYSADAIVVTGLMIGAGIAVWGAMKIGRKFGWM